MSTNINHPIKTFLPVVTQVIPGPPQDIQPGAPQGFFFVDCIESGSIDIKMVVPGTVICMETKP